MKFATIGTGFIVDWFLTSVSLNEGMECLAMYTRTASHAQSLADKYSISKIYTDLDEMLKDDEIEWVYVASVNSLHAVHVMKALKANKHVICEKPFTSNVKEFMEIKEYATSHHLYLFEAIVTTHMPNYQTLKDNLSLLGNIRMVQCNFSQYSSKYNKFLAGETPNVFTLEYSGGSLADINIYNLHFTIGLFGKPKEVHYYPNIARNGVDTSGVAILSYDGFQAVCVGAKDSKSKCIAQIQGEKGYAIVESETSRCGNVTYFVDGETKNMSIQQVEPALYYELKQFKEIVDANDYDACISKLQHSQDVMEVYEACRKDANIIFKADL